jgi:hypothetical protein
MYFSRWRIFRCCSCMRKWSRDSWDFSLLIRLRHWSQETHLGIPVPRLLFCVTVQLYNPRKHHGFLLPYTIFIILGVLFWNQLAWLVSVVTRLWAGLPANWGSITGGAVICLFITVSRPALLPTQPPFRWVQEEFSPGVKQSLDIADHSSRSSTESKNAWNHASKPHTSLRHDV